MSDDAYKHALDVEYEVWRRGYNPDRLDRDAVYDQYNHGLSVDESADRHCQKFQGRQYIEVEPQEYYPHGRCKICECEIHPSEDICGECACEEDGI